jgi:hypothetical protein
MVGDVFLSVLAAGMRESKNVGKLMPPDVLQ